MIDQIKSLLADIQRGQEALSQLNQIAPTLFAQVRYQHGWSMSQLAGRLDIGKAYISLIESGQRPAPPELVERLLNILDE